MLADSPALKPYPKPTPKPTHATRKTNRNPVRTRKTKYKYQLDIPPARNLKSILDQEQENLREYLIYYDGIGYPYYKHALVNINEINPGAAHRPFIESRRVLRRPRTALVIDESDVEDGWGRLDRQARMSVTKPEDKWDGVQPVSNVARAQWQAVEDVDDFDVDFELESMVRALR
eukprot:154148-Prorocentrum_minimum.AAC.1